MNILLPLFIFWQVCEQTMLWTFSIHQVCPSIFIKNHSDKRKQCWYSCLIWLFRSFVCISPQLRDRTMYRAEVSGHQMFNMASSQEIEKNYKSQFSWSHKRSWTDQSIEPSKREIYKCLFLCWTNTTSLQHFKQKMLLQMECEKIIYLISSKQSWQQKNFGCLYSWLIIVQICFWQFYLENYASLIIVLLSSKWGFSFVSAWTLLHSSSSSKASSLHPVLPFTS